MTDERVPNPIATNRQSRGWSQEMLAKKSGLSKQTIYNIEKGNQTRSPELNTVHLIAGAFGLSTSFLVERYLAWWETHQEARKTVPQNDG